MPAWAYARANRAPRATCASDAHISWCGKTRSLPPPWTSNVDPRCSRAMAVHSTCQPGRLARPLRAPQDAVERVLLAGPVGVASPVAEDGQHLLPGPARQLAERGVRGHREVEVVVHAVDRAGALELLDQGHHQRDRLH